MRRMVNGVVALALMLAVAGSERAWGVELGWSTYVGGAREDYNSAMSVDADGNIYLAGHTTSPAWAAGGYDTTLNGAQDACVIKLSPTGAPLWSAYLGGDGVEQGAGIAVDGAGNVYVCGQTQSAGWLSGSFDSSFNASGGCDGFLVKLSNTGQIVWGAYLGGDNDDDAAMLALDHGGDICVVGSTYSEGWLAGGHDTLYDDAQDAYALKVSGDGQLRWGTYLGGGKPDLGHGIAVDGADSIYVAGETQSAGWTSGGFKTAFTATMRDGFVARLTPQGGLAWSTYLSGSEAAASNLALDHDGNICVIGSTQAAGWTAGGADTTYGGGSNDGFLLKLAGDGRLLWSEYLGGKNSDTPQGIAIDSGNQITVTGSTTSSDWGDWIYGGGDSSFSFSRGSADAFVARFSPEGRPVWGVIMGDRGSDSGSAVVALGPASLLVSGQTSSRYWIKGGPDLALSGASDAYVARFNKCDQPTSGSLCVTLTPPEAVAAGAQWRRVGTTEWRDSGATETCVLAGAINVEFKPMPGWIRPAQTLLGVSGGKATVKTAAYSRSGSVRVTIEPPEAVAAGAQWRLAGTLPWFDSGIEQSEAWPGDATVEFKRVANWTSPKSQALTIKAGATTSTAGLYGTPQSELCWGGCLGGSNTDVACGVALDQAENIYVTGYTNSSGWVSGGYDASFNSRTDAFVVKLTSKGEHLWSTYLGGATDDYGYGIAMDRAGNAYVAGSTDSSGWMKGIDDQAYRGAIDGFTVKLSPAGQMLWGVYLGGAGKDEAHGIAVDNLDYPYVTGQTASFGWLFGGFDTTLNGTDAFVAKLSPSTGQKIWGAYVGGLGEESGQAIAVDGVGGSVYLTGYTDGGAWEYGTAGHNSYNGGLSDAFLVKLTYSALDWVSFIGGSADEVGYGVTVDNSGNVFVCGATGSAEWVRNGYNTAYGGGVDGFVIKMTDWGQPVWSTCLGGSSEDRPQGITTDPSGNVFVTGYTSSKDWVSGGFNTNLNSSLAGNYTSPGYSDAFLVKLSGAGQHLWSSYLGEKTTDFGYAVARGGSGDIYVAGSTENSSWLAGGYRSDSPLSTHAFVTRVRELTQPGRGALRVMIEPEGVSGGQWRRVGQSVWRPGGATENNVPEGAHEVEFYTYAGADALPPQPITVHVADGQTTTATGRYEMCRAGVSVTIKPPEAVAAGARWRPLNSQPWLESGAVLSGLPVTTTTVAFAGVPGMNTPGAVKLPLRLGQTTTATVRYEYPGSLKVTITPPEAVGAGAQWRVKGLTEWNDSGTTGSAPLGAQAIEFKPLVGWTHPDDIPVTVTTGAVPRFDVTYVRQYGSLQVDLAPAEAVAAGAQWRRAGTAAWLGSGAREDNVGAGPVGIEFKPTPQWARPQLTTVTVNQGRLTQFTGAYAAAKAGLSWSTYLGGSQLDSCEGVAAGPGGTVYVTGTTSSTGWISGGVAHGGGDAFVTKLSASGQTLWSACLGGDKDENACALAVDGAGAVYVTGETYSSGWASGGFDATYRGARDGFVVKLSDTGQHLWSALLGDAGEDRPRDIALDGSSGAVCITGYTTSYGWLTGGTDSMQRKRETSRHGLNDVFVAKLSADGGRLWSSCLGGAADDYGYGIAVDGSGNLFVTGKTASSGWLERGYSTTLAGGSDAFVLKLSPGGVTLWETCLGGAADDSGSEIAVDALGNVCVVGETQSAGWTAGGFNTTFGGLVDGWMARLTSEGRPVWSAYIGGAGLDECLAVTLDGAGAAYVTGDTQSAGWATTDLDDTLNGVAGSAQDAYVIKVSPGGRHLWSTYLGGDAADVGNDIAVDGAGRVCVAGCTQSAGWTTGGLGGALQGSQDGFIAALQDAGASEPAGSLCVTLTGASGGQWRRAGAATGRSSGATESGVPAGVWALELKPTPGWVGEDPPPVTIASGQTTSASASYVKAASLRVTLAPAEAVQAGARWRRSGTAAWLASGATEELSAGDYAIEFKPTPFWVEPTTQTLSVKAAAQSSLTGAYTPVEQAMSWSTYVGGTSAENAYACAVDAGGNIYVGGLTYSGSWITGGSDASFGGSTDGFLAKLSPTGQLLWSTYLGGANGDYVTSLAVDPAGDICVAGQTSSDGWVSGGGDTSRSGSDGFLAKLASSGELRWSTYVGGSNYDIAYGVAADQAKNIFVCGYTDSKDLVTQGPFITPGARNDGFVLKYAPDGQPLWGSYITGANGAQARGVAIDAAGDVCITGYLSITSSPVPWLKGGFDTTLNGDIDGFIVKFSTNGDHLWGACFGGASAEYSYGIAVDGARNIFVTGSTYSGGWTMGGYDTQFESGASDGFALKASPAGALLWSSYLGGGGQDFSMGVATDRAGNAFVAGVTRSSSDWAQGGFDPAFNSVLASVYDGAIIKLSPSGQRLWSSYLGGSAYDIATAIAVDGEGSLVVAGYTRSTDWITGGHDTLYGGGMGGYDTLYGGSGSSGGDVFVAKIAQKINLRVTLTPSAAAAAGAQWRRVGTTQWRASGETESGIAEGTACEIEFKPAPNWLPPAHAWATVGVGVTDVTAVYEQCGSLAVTITPPAAVAAGAQWRRKGTSLWLASGATDAQAPLGACTVEFTDLTAKYWLAPLPAAATVQAGKTTSLAAAYAPRLLVSAVTPLAVPAALGQRVTLTAAAAGAAPLTFQWTKNGAPIAGATGLTLTLAACKLSDEGAYACVARNPYAQASSPGFRVTVHNGSGVIAYLLGQTANAAGLDLNGDGQVTIADALKGVRTTPPATPSGPSPGSGATGLGIKPRLDWADSVDAASYDLYVWKSSASRPAAPTASGLRASQYDVSAALAYGTTYKWQVIARRPEGVATASGPVWSFTTAKAPAGAPK